MNDDAPQKFDATKAKKSRIDRHENRRILDPRFTDIPNKSKHIKDYAFLYPKDILKSLNERENRHRLENELVKRGKQKFYMNKKHKKELERKKERQEKN